MTEQKGKGKSVWLDYDVIKGLEDLVDHGKDASYNEIFEEVIREFDRLWAVIDRHNLVYEVHPEWKEEEDSVFFENLAEKKE